MNNKGMTLIEVLVSIVASSLIIMTLTSVLTFGLKTYNDMQYNDKMYTAAYDTAEKIQDEIQDFNYDKFEIVGDTIVIYSKPELLFDAEGDAYRDGQEDLNANGILDYYEDEDHKLVISFDSSERVVGTTQGETIMVKNGASAAESILDNDIYLATGSFVTAGNIYDGLCDEDATATNCVMIMNTNPCDINSDKCDDAIISINLIIGYISDNGNKYSTINYTTTIIF